MRVAKRMRHGGLVFSWFVTLLIVCTEIDNSSCPLVGFTPIRNAINEEVDSAEPSVSMQVCGERLCVHTSVGLRAPVAVPTLEKSSASRWPDLYSSGRHAAG